MKDLLYKLSKEALDLSYSPYSKFRVGACVITNDGKTFKGANIENASYPLSMCAERNAIYHAYMNGYKKEDIKALMIIADTKDVVSPCGACRQVLSELVNENTIIYLANTKKEIKEYKIDELLPFRFKESDLNNA